MYRSGLLDIDVESPISG